MRHTRDLSLSATGSSVHARVCTYIHRMEKIARGFHPSVPKRGAQSREREERESLPFALLRFFSVVERSEARVSSFWKRPDAGRYLPTYLPAFLCAIRVRERAARCNSLKPFRNRAPSLHISTYATKKFQKYSGCT